MPEEGEYRHLLLTNATSTSSLQLNEVPSYGINTFLKKDLLKKKKKNYCSRLEEGCK